MPEYIPTDPLFANQWYLRNTGQTGFGSGTLDLNVTEVWPDYTGAGVTIAVYDNGVDYNHEDLNDNYDASQHVIIDGNPSDADWLPPGSVGGSSGFNAINAHGTGMAGIAAAENNDVGGVGVAFDATLVGVYTPILGQSTPPSELVQALEQLDNFDVALFASGGPTFFGGAQNANWLPVHEAMQAAATDGRDGLGTIVLNSVHNNGPAFGNYDTNASQWDNTRFALHVGGVNDEGVVVPNATRSSAMHVSGFTGFQATGIPPASPRNIIGTDITGADGAVAGDYAAGGGTTSAVSQIAGVAALVLEANPELGWRDVQAVMVDAARHTGSAVGDPPNVGASETDGWEFNGAGDWNGGGRHYSIDYGYGVVDALAAVRLAETWLIGTTAATSANEASSINAIAPGNLAIPDNTGGSLTLPFVVTDNIEIETVQLRLGFNHTRAQDLRIELTSPDGSFSTFLHPMTNGTNNVTGNGWRFNSQEFRGELSAGTWTVTVTDTVSGNTGTLNGNSALVFFGASDTANDRYVYSNAFSDYAALGARATLTDTDGGTDTINAAAVAGDSTIDLTNGATSTIDGQTLTIANGSDIENAIAGDGNDSLTGNALANILHGGRGDDALTGGAGDDELFGSAGTDDAVFTGALADYLITEVGAGRYEVADQRGGAPDGTDLLVDVETASFADGTFTLADLVSDELAVGDVLWQRANGAVATVGHELGVVSGSWEISGTGDFDGDGDSDILWHHAEGLTVIWELEGGDYAATHTVETAATPWQIAATGDFDGDGDDDIVWRHDDGQVAVWEMQDSAYVQNHNLAEVSPNWRIAGTGDFDGDGDDDIVWQHSDGHVVAWEMQDGAYVGNHNLPDVATTWQIAGTGDFDGDGDSDLLWRHDEGLTVTWELQDFGYVQNHNLAEVDTRWQIAGTWDLDSDADADIVWRQESGLVVTWAMQDGELLQTQDHGVVSSAWQIRGTGEFDLV